MTLCWNQSKSKNLNQSQCKIICIHCICTLITYCGVVGPEVLHGEVIPVEVTLCQVLHNHNVDTFDPFLMVKTAPAGEGTKTHTVQSYSHRLFRDSVRQSNRKRHLSLPGLFGHFPQSSKMQQLRQLTQRDRLLQSVELHGEPGGARCFIAFLLSLHSFVAAVFCGLVPLSFLSAARLCYRRLHASVK